MDNADNNIEALRAVLDRPVVLVGLMGSGKSTMGRALARALGKGFCDADEVIADKAGKTIAQIFEEDGEPAFRELERAVIAKLLDGKSGVISTGGGAFMNDSTRAQIAQKGVAVWLRADINTLAKRTAGDRKRPLLKGGDPIAALRALMDTRYPVYAQADITVDTGIEPAEQTLDKIIDALCRHTGC